MPTLNATPKSTTANTYVTLDEAEAYFLTRLYASAWSSADQATKETALIQATRLLDLSFAWKGAERTLTQALRWPRSGVRNLDNYWYDYDTIPQPLKNGTCEMALTLLESNRLKEPTILQKGINQLSVGPISLTIDKNFGPALVTRSVQTYLEHLGLLIGSGSGGFKTTSLKRV